MVGLRKISWSLVAILISQLVLSVLAGALVTYEVGHTRAPEGLSIWGKDLSGLSENEALEILEREIPSAVVYQEKVYSFDIYESRKEIRGWLRNQYSSNTGNWFTDAFKYLKHITQNPEPPQKLIRDEVLPQLDQLSQLIDRQGSPAHLNYENGMFVLEKGIPRTTLNIEATWEALNQSMNQSTVPLVVDTEDIHPTTIELHRVKDVLGDYTTYFNPNLIGRVNNVQLAAKALDGLIIPPGGEFSFNGAVGKRERETGYLPALVFVDNKVVLDDGGGICQDSSTLYQAARQANLQILERNSHSLPVYYVPAGQDATVAYGLLDFRFKNNTEGYLLISARTGTNWIRIRIFGVSDDKHPVLSDPDGYPTKPVDWLNDPK